MSQDLWSHKAKCRLCLQRFKTNENSVEVTETVRQKFFRFTNVEVGKDFPNVDCSITFIILA